MKAIPRLAVLLLCTCAVSAQAPNKNQTYTGCIEGNVKEGFALKLLSVKPAKDPKVASQPTFFSLAVPDGPKIDLATMANQRVDIIGVLTPVKTNDKSGKRQTLTIREIAIVPGGC
jgi:hypothetical protein